MKEKYTFRNWNNIPLHIKSAGGIYLYSKGKNFRYYRGGTSFAVLGWNNKEINKTILEQLNKFHHLDYKIFKDDNIENSPKYYFLKQSIN